MARHEEEWEDEDYEEEEEEQEEDEEDIVDMFKSEIRRLTKERSQYGSLSQEYMVLTQRISDITEQIRNAEEANNEKAQQESARRGKHDALLQMAGGIAGNIAGTVVGCMFNRANVKTVVGYENDGGIVNSKALKYTK